MWEKTYASLNDFEREQKECHMDQRNLKTAKIGHLSSRDLDVVELRP